MILRVNEVVLNNCMALQYERRSRAERALLVTDQPHRDATVKKPAGSLVICCVRVICTGPRWLARSQVTDHYRAWAMRRS